MSSEVYLGEGDCRRIEALTCAIEQLTAALVESTNSSHNNARDEICPYCNMGWFTFERDGVNVREECIVCRGSGKRSPVA